MRFADKIRKDPTKNIIHNIELEVLWSYQNLIGGMAYLAVAGIPYERWVKFFWKLILGWVLIALVAIVIAIMIGVS